ncbi:unnamed protein product [Caenorhabditis angaria]|uniref:C-type lectin domain-containing protein n=1 Tax=Caenorhabditis angaria TaxID=860376 RepID=A0A9P1IDH0_9PELO|nr:unnamed protein product [Caenorhabditis angaria]
MDALKIILLYVLFALTLQSSIRDESFVRFCGKVGGGVTTTTGNNLNGMTCRVTWNILTNNDEVEQVCKIKAPYPLKAFEVNINKKAECTYENVYTCRPDYTQINGYCYRVMSDKLISYEDAEKKCKSQKTKLEISGKEVTSAIVDLFDEDLIRIFEFYFEEMRSIWIQPRDDYKDQIDYEGDSENYAIVYGMATFYNVGPNSLIKMPKNHRAQAMCHYRAEETPNSFGYNAKKLAKYYYPTLQRGDLTVWRTSGSYNYWTQNQDKSFAINQCQKSMAAIAGNTEIDVFNPTKDNMKILREDDAVKESFIKAYSPSYLCCYDVPSYYDRGWHYDHYSIILHFSKSYSPFVCNQNTKLPHMSSALYSFSPQYHSYLCRERVGTFLLFSEPVSGIDNVEVFNRQDAPHLCSIYFENIRVRTKCPDGWKMYQRENERIVCHNMFTVQRNYDDAQKLCGLQGAQLSTFTSKEEYDFLRNVDASPWIGARKENQLSTLYS